jgi:hypothetical protein
MGQMAGAIMPQLSNAVARAGFQQQLGQASNQMYQPPNQMGGYDPYTAMRRPNYMPFGPNQQFYQPVYQPSYSQFSNFGYGQAPFGGFYQPPMQSRFRPMPFMNQTQIDARNAAAAPPPSYDSGGAKAGGKVDDDGIASLLKK